MKTITLEIGSTDWIKSRSASKAAAVMGQDAHTSRNELLRMMATGIGKEFTDWQQKHLLDKGHESEVGAIKYAETIIGDDLSPICGATDDDYLIASFDGISFGGNIAAEAKAWNEALAASVRNGIVPDTHWPQLEQQILVGGLDYVLFVVGDGTPEKTASVEYRAIPGRAERLIASWHQFDIDLANYQPAEVIPAAVAAPQLQLPAVSIQVNGSIALIDNLAVFGNALTAYVGKINQKPETDQDFADLDATVKTLKTAEDALTAAENGALAQTASIDQMRRQVAQYKEIARVARLQAEKTVKAEKENRRAAIIAKGMAAIEAHVSMLNTRLGRPYMPRSVPDFAGSVKGLKTISSTQNAVDSELARCKINANEAADRIEINLNFLREHAKEYAFLFADAAQIVLKANDDFAAMATLRINEHKAEQERKLEEERQRIRAEEEEKARTEAEAKVRAEQEEAARQQRESDELAAKVKCEAEMYDQAQARIAEQKALTSNTTPPPASTTANEGIRETPALGQRETLPASADNGLRMRLDTINAAIAPLSISSEGLAQLGFPHVGTDKAAKLYREQDMAAICESISRHVIEAARKYVL